MNLSLRPNNILGHLPSTLWSALAAAVTAAAGNLAGLPAPYPTICNVLAVVALILGALAGPTMIPATPPVMTVPRASGSAYFPILFPLILVCVVFLPARARAQSTVNACGLTLSNVEVAVSTDGCWTLHPAFTAVGVEYSLLNKLWSTQVQATFNGALDYRHLIGIAAGGGYASGPTTTGLSADAMLVGPPIPGVTFARPGIGWTLQKAITGGVPNNGLFATLSVAFP